jgi:hypothetical protein
LPHVLFLQMPAMTIAIAMKQQLLLLLHSHPTWEQRLGSRLGSWKIRASCSTAPFSMP